MNSERYGVKKARKKGILTEADVEKLVFEGRDRARRLDTNT